MAKEDRSILLFGEGSEPQAAREFRELGIRAMLSLEAFTQALEEAPTAEYNALVARKARELFGASAAAIGRYDEARSALVLEEISWSEADEGLVTKLIGRGMAGLAAPIGAEEMRRMHELRVGVASTLSEFSFGHIPAPLGKALETALGIGWFRGLVLESKDRLFGGLGLAGRKGSEEPNPEILRVFAAICSNAIKRRDAEEKVARLLQEKELLLHEVHHRIKNNLNTAISLLSIQARSCGSPEAAAALRDAMGRLQSMSSLYDKVYRSEDLLDISLSRYLPNLAEEIVALFPNRDRVELRTEVEDLVLDAKKLPPLGIIVYELVSNSMKYAFPEGRSGFVAVSAKASGGGFELRVEDDGVGPPEGADLSEGADLPEGAEAKRKNGFGLGLVRLLVGQLEGRLSIERGRGLRYVIRIDGARPRP